MPQPVKREKTARNPLGAGRPSSYTQERADRYVAAVELGATYTAASAAAGVSLDTSTLWKQNMPEFSARVHEAEQLREVAWLNTIRKAQTKGEWKAAVWLLEHLNRDAYGRFQKMDARITGRDGGPIEHEVSFDGGLDDATAALAHRAIETIFGATPDKK